MPGNGKHTEVGPEMDRREYMQGTAAAGMAGVFGWKGQKETERKNVMDIGAEPFQEKIEAGEPVYGLSAAFAGMDSTTVLANAPSSDYVWIDTEHGSYDIRAVREKIAVFPKETEALVRVTGTSPKEVERSLDAGADGVIIPKRRTVEEVKEYVESAYYPPKGDRGAAGSIAAGEFGLDFDNYFEKANENVFVMVQIEREALLDDIDEVAQIDGIDALFVSGSDLSISLGVPFNTTAPVFQRAAEKVRQAAERNGLVAATIPTEQDVETLIEKGYRLFLLGSDAGYLATAIEERFPD
jgi:4-hydroxy-2-oxoheptanedioate aldolase